MRTAAAYAPGNVLFLHLHTVQRKCKRTHMAGGPGQSKPLLWEPHWLLPGTIFCSKTMVWPAHPAFPSPTRTKNTILLVHLSTPVQILHPTFALPSLTASFIDWHSFYWLASFIDCSLPWSGPLALVQNGLIHEDICILSPVPACLCNSNYSVLTRAILAHPYSKHRLEFYHQPRLSDRQKRMEGEGRDEAVTVSCAALN